MDPITEKVLKPKLNPVFEDFEAVYQIMFPLYISGMVFDREASKVDIFISYHKKATFPCACDMGKHRVHSKIPRIWRALDIANLRCYLHMDVPRLNCPSIGVKLFQVPWARDHSHLTIPMEKDILSLSTHIPISELAKRLGESEHRLIKLITQAGLEPKKMPRASRASSPRNPPTEEKPAEDNPPEERLPEERLPEEKPTEEKPTEEKPTEDKPAED
jgi:hypothetical protein